MKTIAISLIIHAPDLNSYSRLMKKAQADGTDLGGGSAVGAQIADAVVANPAGTPEGATPACS